MERHSHIQFILQLLIDGAPKCPVFLYSVECSVTAGSFHQPPHPGMLVFLMRLLHLDYQHPASIYLYDTIPHLKMATAAGLKYLKASQFFKRPQMAVRFGPSVSRPSVPVLLQDMEMCVPVGDEWKVTPQIPLAEQVDKQSSARPMSQNLGHGRRLYLAVKKAEVFHRWGHWHCAPWPLSYWMYFSRGKWVNLLSKKKIPSYDICGKLWHCQPWLQPTWSSWC